MKNAYAQRYQDRRIFFELGRILFIVQNKNVSFDFSQMNSEDYFTHHSEIIIHHLEI